MESAIKTGNPDIVKVFGELSCDRCVTVAQRSSEVREIFSVRDATVTLRYSLSRLPSAYNGLDLASGRLRWMLWGAQ